MGRLSPASIVEAGVAGDALEDDAFFISCTALPAIDVVTGIEARIGKPVVASNQAARWLTRGHAGHHAPLTGRGGLLSLSAPGI